MAQALHSCNGQTLKVVQTHDCLSLLVDRIGGLKNNYLPSFRSLTAKAEGDLLHGVDLILSIAEYEKKVFEVLAPFSNHVVLGYSSDDYLPLNISFGRGLVTICSDNPFNIQGILHFIANIYSKSSILRQTTFHIIGSACNCPELIYLASQFPLITLNGVVHSYNEIIEQSSVLINPVLVGSGLKIKTVEALGYGIPVVGFQEAFSGLDDFQSSGCSICFTDSQMIRHLELLFTSFTFWHSEKNSQAIYRDNYLREDVVSKSFLQYLQSISIL